MAIGYSFLMPTSAGAQRMIIIVDLVCFPLCVSCSPLCITNSYCVCFVLHLVYTLLLLHSHSLIPMHVHSPSVLDRLNALLEPGGVLSLDERGIIGDSQLVIRPHPNFR